jgi:hypothetical protein
MSTWVERKSSPQERIIVIALKSRAQKGAGREEGGWGLGAMEAAGSDWRGMTGVRTRLLSRGCREIPRQSVLQYSLVMYCKVLLKILAMDPSK